MCLRHTGTGKRMHPHRGWRSANVFVCVDVCAEHPFKSHSGKPTFGEPKLERALAWICEKYAWEFERLRMSLWCVCICLGCFKRADGFHPHGRVSADNFVMAQHTHAPTQASQQYTCYIWLGDVPRRERLRDSARESGRGQPRRLRASAGMFECACTHDTHARTHGILQFQVHTSVHEHTHSFCWWSSTYFGLVWPECPDGRNVSIGWLRICSFN